MDTVRELADLPDDCLLSIVSFCGAPSLCALGASAKFLRRATNSAGPWRALLRRECGVAEAAAASAGSGAAATRASTPCCPCATCSRRRSRADCAASPDILPQPSSAWPVHRDRELAWRLARLG